MGWLLLAGHTPLEPGEGPATQHARSADATADDDAAAAADVADRTGGDRPG
jgi:hypothetical protein